MRTRRYLNATVVSIVIGAVIVGTAILGLVHLNRTANQPVAACQITIWLNSDGTAKYPVNTTIPAGQCPTTNITLWVNQPSGTNAGPLLNKPVELLLSDANHQDGTTLTASTLTRTVSQGGGFYLVAHLLVSPPYPGYIYRLSVNRHIVQNVAIPVT